jgi:hypothetical protein
MRTFRNDLVFVSVFYTRQPICIQSADHDTMLPHGPDHRLHPANRFLGAKSPPAYPIWPPHTSFFPVSPSRTRYIVVVPGECVGDYFGIFFGESPLVLLGASDCENTIE